MYTDTEPYPGSCQHSAAERMTADEWHRRETYRNQIRRKAKTQSVDGVQHINQRLDGSWYVSDWYSENTVESYYRGELYQ